MHHRAMTFRVAVTLLLVGHRVLVAQNAVPDSTHSRHGGTLIGFSIGVPGYLSTPVPELLTVGINVTEIKPNRLGADFAIGTIPRAFAYGAGVIGARSGVVLPAALGPDLLLLPSAGGSFVGGAGEGGGAAFGGVNAGLATIVWTGSGGVRTGVTLHRLVGVPGTIWLVEFGWVQAKLP